MVLVMVKVVLFLVPPTYTPRKLLLSETDRIGGLFNLRTSTQDIHLVLVMVMMVNVVWTLGPATLPPKKLIVRLMVVILYHLKVGNINP